MDCQKTISYIQLINTQGIGAITFHKLIRQFGDVDKALAEVSRKYQVFPRKKAEDILNLAKSKKVKIITSEDSVYPVNLKQIADYPPILYALGNVELLKNTNALAVVGARTASLSALKMAENLSSQLAARDIVIVSGLAKGIDGAAHKGALSANGYTIAVLGTGIDIVYPKENEGLFKDIINKKGLILSEYTFNTAPQASNFPKRNRIVSGLSKGVLVVEAGIQSGSLITAKQALDQGRDVYAIPGAPYDGRASGCNKLLKEGAILVDSVNDILDNFSFEKQIAKSQECENEDLFEYLLDNVKNNKDISEQEGISKKNKKSSGNKINEHDKVLSLISETGEDIDELIRVSGLPSEQVLVILMELELDGKIIRLPVNKVAKT